MPFLDMLEFTARDLAVAYRASAEPQILEIDVDCAQRAQMGLGPILMRGILEGVEHGAAGGAEFSPSIGEVKKLEGPEFKTPEAHGPHFHWKLEVRGAAPLFVRTIVEHLRGLGGMNNKILSMRIRGSLPLDDSPLSVREADVRRWIEDGSTYLGRFPKVPFAFKDKRAPKGASVRVSLDGEVTKEIYEAFEMYVAVYGASLTDYAAQNGKGMGMIDVFAKLGKAKTELSARWAQFTHVRGPSTDLAANMLTRFHDKVAPIREVELALA